MSYFFLFFFSLPLRSGIFLLLVAKALQPTRLNLPELIFTSKLNGDMREASKSTFLKNWIILRFNCTSYTLCYGKRPNLKSGQHRTSWRMSEKKKNSLKDQIPTFVPLRFTNHWWWMSEKMIDNCRIDLIDLQSLHNGYLYKLQPIK